MGRSVSWTHTAVRIIGGLEGSDAGHLEDEKQGRGGREMETFCVGLVWTDEWCKVA